MAGGRPTKYKADYARQAKKLCELGATVPELAEFFEVNESTVHLWMVKFKQFSKAVKAGREPADNRVEASLYKRAIGYEQDTVKVMQFKGEPVIIPYRERIAPDVAACIFWLKNRRPEECIFQFTNMANSTKT